MRGLSSGIGVLHRTYKYSVKGRYLGGIALYALCYEYQNRGGPSRCWARKKRGIACGQDDVHTLCEALEIPRGTLCNHILRNKRANAQFEKRREEYRLLICEVFAEYRQVLGAEKIWMILARRGHQVGAKFGADLMREMGLSSVRSTAKQDYLKLREPEKKKNILRQQFSTDVNSGV